jgi:hypothetical protein
MDNSIEDLTSMPNLRELDLTRNNISDAGVARLAKLPHLQVLSLANTAISDAGLDELAAFPALRELDIRETEVIVAGLKSLRAVKNLAVLKIGHYSKGIVTASLVKELGKIPQVRRLYVRSVAALPGVSPSQTDNLLHPRDEHVGVGSFVRPCPV